MSISIVIPTKNEEHHLPTLLESIKRQTVQPDEIIVADAHSSDRTRAIAESFGANVIDGGLPARGRNKGAAQAKSDIILFLDADVELRDPTFLEKSIKEFLERNLGLATCDVFPLSDAFVDHFLHKAYNTYVRAWGSVFPHAPGFCMFVRRDLHNALGGFDESVVFCEDHDYARRFVDVGTFGFLRSTKIPVSIRRLDRDGRTKIAMKYLLAELHTAFVGPIRSDRFHYTFGHEKRSRLCREKKN
jgi:glycosyltransferase involved in cell wall biosynthesis